MTFEECQHLITFLRQKQGTPRPIVRVDYAGTVYQGRIVRFNAGDQNGQQAFGVLELEDPGLSRRPATLIQIANIPPGGIGEPMRN